MRAFARTVVIVAALAFVGWWLLGVSPSFQACVQEKQNRTANSDPQDYISALVLLVNSYRDCLFPIIHDSHNEILAVFTIILAIATIFLWFTTSDLVRGVENTSKRQLRAYIGIATASIQTIEAYKTPVVLMRFQNFGLTPAYRLRYWADIVVENVGATKLKVNKTLSGRIILNPSDGFNVTSIMDVLTTDAANSVLDDTQRLFLVGEIRYRDAFGTRRRTNFRYETYGRENIARQRMMVSARGNTAT